MNRLTLMRHAKSSWDGSYKDDFDRPLNKRGRRDAPLMGAVINEQLGAPDIVLCSDAARTRETLTLAAPHFSNEPAIDYQHTLYLASPAQLLASIAATGTAARAARKAAPAHILVIAHNPGLHALSLSLADPARSRPQDLIRLAEKFPTAALAHFTFDTPDWPERLPRKGILKLFATPKSLLHHR